MSPIGNNQWQGYIPAHSAGSVIEYYLFGESQSGKTQLRPMPAPAGHWSFEVLGEIGVNDITNGPNIMKVFPNPAQAITCIELNFNQTIEVDAFITDMTGKRVHILHQGNLEPRRNKLFFNAENLAPGMYFIQIASAYGTTSQKVLIK